MLGMEPARAPDHDGLGGLRGDRGRHQFVARGRYDRRAALGLCLGGPPGVAAAVRLVTSLPLATIRIVVIFVVIYTALSLFRSAAIDARAAAIPAGEPVPQR